MSGQPLLTGDFDEESTLFKSLLVDTKSELDREYERHQKNESNLVAPKPGWCLKTWTLSGDEKIFVNVCTSEMVLKPKDLSEDEVRKIVESEDPTKFRIPMGIGEAHKERENTGKGIRCFDMNRDFYRVQVFLIFSLFSG